MPQKYHLFGPMALARRITLKLPTGQGSNREHPLRGVRSRRSGLIKQGRALFKEGRDSLLVVGGIGTAHQMIGLQGETLT